MRNPGCGWFKKNQLEGQKWMCDKSTYRGCLCLKRTLPSHWMLVNIVQIFQKLGKLSLTILIIIVCHEGFILFSCCSITKLQDCCQWPLAIDFNWINTHTIVIWVQIRLQWMKYIFLSFLSKKCNILLWCSMWHSTIAIILLNNFILFFMFVHIKKKLIIKLPSGVEEYQLIKL